MAFWYAGIVFLGLIVMAVVWALAFERVGYERSNVVDDALRNNSNLSLALQEQTLRTIRSVDQVLRFIEREYLDEGVQPSMQRLLTQVDLEDGLFHNLGVIDSRGRLILSREPKASMVDLSDRDYFQAHRIGDSGKLFIGKPLIGRITGEPVIPMSRRITGSDGSFRGVVFGGVDVNYFTEFYQRTNLGKDGVIMLIGLDGIARARRTGDRSHYGQDMSNSTLFSELAKAREGSYLSVGKLEGVPRFVSYRTLAQYPIVVAVGTSRDSVFAGSNIRERNYYTGAALTTFFVVVFSAILMAALARQRRAQKEVQLQNTVLATLQEVSLDAILLVDGNGRIITYNRRFIDMWGIAPELIHAGDDAPLLDAVTSKMEDPEGFLARVRYLYEHRAERGKDEIRVRDGRTIERYSAPVIGPDAEYLGRVWYFRDITLLLRSMSDLRASEERFRQIAETIGEVFWMAPPDLSSINYVSPAFEKIWGRSCEELYARPLLWVEAVHAEDREAVIWAAEKLAAGAPYDIEYRIQRPDGALRWINDRGYAMRDAAGKIVLTSGIASDITDAKSSEAAVRAEQRRRQAILDSIPDMAWLKDTDSRFLAVNDALARAAGLPAPELIGKMDRDFLPADIADRYRADDIEVMRTGEHKRIEEDILDAAGVRRLLETIKTRVCDPSGRVIGTVGIARDISERRKSEEELRLSANAFDSIADGILVTDPHQRIVSVNKAFTRITGYSENELIGRTPKALQSGRHDDNFYSDMWSELQETGHWKGEIWDRRKSGEVYPQLLSISAIRDQAGALTHYVGVSTDISSLKRYEEELHHQAHHDALTGLPNRALFQERFGETLNRAQRHGHQCAILFLDLDHFKNINDSLGHAVGDLLLQAVAKRLASSVREVDTVARFGGDEFAVLLDVIDDSQGAATVAQKLLDVLASPFQIEAHEFFVSASIGIGCYPQDGERAEDLFKNADTAMYRAKSEGRNNYQFFSIEMNAKALENLQLSNALRAAIERKELLLHFQPCVELRSGRVSSVEALVRWNHPELGMVPPARFIPIAEETGLIEQVGNWVLRTACAQMRAWRDAGFQLDRIAVNLSARQFRRPELTDYVATVLKDVGLPADCLELEVTESVVMRDPDGASQVLARLKAMGISIAIDDFGTGYSSLSYLKRFPIDFLKIDRSFVSGVPADTDDVAITRAIVALARSLNLRLIAEGVETAEQRAFLEQHGCDEGQGYLFSKPVPAQDITTRLQMVAAGRPVEIAA
jgi:diguanylate cyclase (GGDEF)-like protein/PAS domain S-box-containing protein